MFPVHVGPMGGRVLGVPGTRGTHGGKGPRCSRVHVRVIGGTVPGVPGTRGTHGGKASDPSADHDLPRSESLFEGVRRPSCSVRGRPSGWMRSDASLGRRPPPRARRGPEVRAQGGTVPRGRGRWTAGSTDRPNAPARGRRRLPAPPCRQARGARGGGRTYLPPRAAHPLNMACGAALRRERLAGVSTEASRVTCRPGPPGAAPGGGSGAAGRGARPVSLSPRGRGANGTRLNRLIHVERTPAPSFAGRPCCAAHPHSKNLTERKNTR